MKHYNRTPLRRAEFIKPPNVLKQKAGSGGVSDAILDKAQKLLEENTLEFEPLGTMYLGALMGGIEKAKGYSHANDVEEIMASMLYPAMQLKANGGMFRYNLVSEIADKLIHFLEVLEEPDIEAVEIILAFHTAITAIIQGRIKGDGGTDGAELLRALTDACMRFFERHPETAQ
jgi:hypothetical protein